MLTTRQTTTLQVSAQGTSSQALLELTSLPIPSCTLSAFPLFQIFKEIGSILLSASSRLSLYLLLRCNPLYGGGLPTYLLISATELARGQHWKLAKPKLPLIFGDFKDAWSLMIKMIKKIHLGKNMQIAMKAKEK